MNWYPSKVDWWLGALIALLPLSLVAVWVDVGSNEELIAAASATVLVVGILAGLAFPMRYGLDSDVLVIRFGLCRQRIGLAAITEVEPSRNPLASPALSMDRLMVRYGSSRFSFVLISPADRDRFLDDLAHRAGLTREGDRLSRVGPSIPVP